LRGVTFQYPSRGAESGFAVGPIDLEIRRSEVVFITGGNGSGKSTLLKLLTGLYLPTSGTLTVNNIKVTANPIGADEAKFVAGAEQDHADKGAANPEGIGDFVVTHI